MRRRRARRPRGLTFSYFPDSVPSFFLALADGRTRFFKFIPADGCDRLDCDQLCRIHQDPSPRGSSRASYKVSFYFHARSSSQRTCYPPESSSQSPPPSGVKSGKRSGLCNSATNFHTKSPDETEFRGRREVNLVYVRTTHRRHSEQLPVEGSFSPLCDTFFPRFATMIQTRYKRAISRYLFFIARERCLFGRSVITE